jgi:hypothetical protein
LSTNVAKAALFSAGKKLSFKQKLKLILNIVHGRLDVRYKRWLAKFNLMLKNHWDDGINGVADEITEKEFLRYKISLERAEKKYDHGLEVEYKGRDKKALSRKVGEGRKVIGVLEMDK